MEKLKLSVKNQLATSAWFKKFFRHANHDELTP